MFKLTFRGKPIKLSIFTLKDKNKHLPHIMYVSCGENYIGL